MMSDTRSSSRFRRAAARPGFTLLEMVVAMAVGAVAIAAGFAALAMLQDRADLTEDTVVAALAGATTRHLLTDWLAGARVRSQMMNVFFEGIAGESGTLPDDQLVLPSVAMTALQEPATIRLFVERDATSPNRGLVAELWTALDVEPVTVQLIPEVVGLRLRYLPDVGAATEWLPDWAPRQSLPRAIEMTLIAEPPEALPPALRLPIRVVLETLWAVDAAGRAVTARDLRARTSLSADVAGIAVPAATSPAQPAPAQTAPRQAAPPAGRGGQ